MNKHIFTLMDITNEAREHLIAREYFVTSKMTEAETKAYKLGIRHTLDMIDQIVALNEHYIIPIIGKDTENVSYENLIW